jgi:hypothetical protein
MSSKKRSGSRRTPHQGRVTPKGTRPPDVEARIAEAEAEADVDPDSEAAAPPAPPASRAPFSGDHQAHGRAAGVPPPRSGRRGNR